MADNLDLQIVIDAVLHSEGFKDSQDAIKALTDRINELEDQLKKSTKTGQEATREIGGRRGAIADLTRVMLMNAGVTGSAGEVARAAGVSFSALAGGASLLSAGALGIVASVSVLLPKLLEWANSSDKVEEEHRKLITSLVAGLPDLERLAESIGHVSEGLERQIDATRQLAFNAQKDRIAKLNEEIKALREQLPAEQAIIETHIDGAKALAAFAALEVARGRELTEQEKKEERLRLELEEKLGLRQRLQEADAKGLTLEHLEAAAAKNKADADDEASKALQRRIREEERERQIQLDIIRETGRRQQAAIKAHAEDKKRQAEDLKMAVERIHAMDMEKGATISLGREAVMAKRAEQAALAELWASAIQTTVGAFTKNKAINIAAAIADTYAAAVKAYNIAGGGPWGLGAMALTIAQGLAQVQNIRKANIGFDDPVNDLLAARLGRKFALDVLNNINAGFGEGLRDLSARNVYHQTTINRGTTVNLGGVHGFIGSQTEFEKRLVRTITQAQRGETRATS